jgi:predicted DNA-binding protein with PD1-like motif
MRPIKMASMGKPGMVMHPGHVVVLLVVRVVEVMVVESVAQVVVRLSDREVTVAV